MSPETLPPLTSAFAIVLLIGAGILAQWLSWLLKLPSILLLLAIGLALGPMGIGVLVPTQFVPEETLFTLVSAAVAIILFEGGLSLRLEELTHGGATLKRLLYLGVPLTLVLSALLLRWLVFPSWELAWITGAILVVTGPTVVTPLLHSIRPAGRVGPIAKWEGILNDPIGALLAVLLLEGLLVAGVEHGVMNVLGGMGLALLIGVGSGFAAAAITAIGMHRRWIPDHLQGVMALALTLFIFFGCDYIVAESGLLAVTLYGAALANQKWVSVRHIIDFKEHLRTLLIAALFIILAAGLTRDQVAMLDYRILLFLAISILVVRPLVVWASSAGTSLAWRDRAFLAFLAPRGIVAAAMGSLFAIKLDKAGVANADIIEPVLYAVIIGTVLIYGLGARPLAAVLGLTRDHSRGILMIGAQDWARDLAELLVDHDLRVRLLDSDRDHVANARLRGLDAHNFSIIEERIEERVDLEGIGTLVALTRSDEANALAALRFAELVGRRNVYQLGGENQRRAAQRRTIPLENHLSGVPLAGGDLSYTDIDERICAGATFKASRLTEDYGKEEFLARYPDAAIIATIDEQGRPHFNESTRPNITAGSTVIALVGGSIGGKECVEERDQQQRDDQSRDHAKRQKLVSEGHGPETTSPTAGQQQEKELEEEQEQADAQDRAADHHGKQTLGKKAQAQVKRMTNR